MTDIAYLADQPHYADEVADGTWRLWGYLLEADGIDDETFRDMVRSRAVKDRLPLTLVASDAGKLAGAISLKLEEPGTMPGLSPWIGGLFVNQAWRGRGLGRELLVQAELAAAALGVQTLYLSCEAHNEAFYARLGWRVRDRVMSCGDQVALMEKLLCA